MLDPIRTSRPRATRRRAPARTASHFESVEPRLLFATFTVTNTNDEGPGSFRQAIIDANLAQNDPEGIDDIVFAIPGTGIPTIRPTRQLDPITDAVWIKGIPDDLSSTTPTVEIDGSLAGAANGLVIASDSDDFASFVSGLIINRFSQNGILITGDGNGVGLVYIGTNQAGTAAGAGNGGHGVLIQSSNNFVNDSIIAFNGGDGVAVVNNGDTPSVANDISYNNFFQNGGLAIDLGNDGRTPNDATDADTGPNDLQNFPVLTVTAAPNGGVTITGTVTTTPNTPLDIALYSNPAGEDEGRVQLDNITGDTNGDDIDDVITNANGVYTFTRTYASASQADAYTATATELFIADDFEYAINTSEFSDPARIIVDGATVSQVYVRGTGWNANFGTWLEANGQGDDVLGYRVDNLAANTTVPWTNVNQIVVRYADPVTGGVPQPSTYDVDSTLGGYTVTAVTPIGTDNTTFALTLDRALGVLQAPAVGTDGDRVEFSVAGGGAGGATYDLLINSLQGDANRANGRVTSIDVAFVRARANRTATETPPTGLQPYSGFADLTADGRINATDISAVRARLNDQLPAAPVPAGELFSSTSITDAILSA